MTWDQARANELQRLRAAWPSKTKGTLANPYPHLSGWCNPSFPLDDNSHIGCSGYGPESPSVGVMRCICKCHLLLQRTAATVLDPATGAVGAGGSTNTWTWEADAAAEIMLQEDGGCPMCNSAWDAHLFLDDGRVACP